MIRLVYAVATLLGAGYLPYAPGTWGTLVTLIVLFLAIKKGISLFVLGLLSISLFFMGQFACGKILSITSHKDRDPCYIVVDEAVGLLTAVTLLGTFHPLDSKALILSFGTFRFFDIFKPGPIGWIDDFLSQSSKTAPWGIMLDDVLAGIATAFTVYFISLGMEKILIGGKAFF